MTQHLNISIGYDSKEPLTLEVLSHSIIKRASKPVSIIPIALNHLKEVYTREDRAGTTEFSLTRFLTPYLSNYRGWSLFLDSDMIVQCDVYDIFNAVTTHGHDGKSVYVVKHDYRPAMGAKATGPQTDYPRKNWSSVMLFNNASCRMLTPGYVNTATPAQLHRFVWVDDSALGSLPVEWNQLVGEYEPNPDAKILHYTLGAPCFPGYEDSAEADAWWNEHNSMCAPLKTYQWGYAEMFTRELPRHPVVG